MAHGTWRTTKKYYNKNNTKSNNIHKNKPVLQAHLGDKIHGDKIQPKVGRHKVREVKNHKVLEPHRNISKINRPARPSGGPAAPLEKKQKKQEEVHFPFLSAAFSLQKPFIHMM